MLACMQLTVLLVLVTAVFGALVPMLGQKHISFPTSTSSEPAQRQFILGLAWLHNFGYGNSMQSFEAAIALDPSFCMAYWGLALANAQPVWSTANITRALQALSDLQANCNPAAVTQREVMYIGAVRSLWARASTGPHDVPFNISAYITDMESLVAAHPGDLEAKLLTVVAYYAIILPEVRGFLTRSPAALVRVRGLLSTVLQAIPQHPGALHYWTHLNDDPDHAFSALPQGHLYSRVAPDSSHAQHMQSHLRLRVGDFRQATTANVPWCDQNNDDTHNLEFLQYAHLQQGKWANALAESETMLEMGDPLSMVQYLFMLTRSYIDMRAEDQCKTLMYDFNCTEACNLPGDWLWYWQALTGYLSVCGFAAAKRGDMDMAQDIVNRITTISLDLNAELPTFAISANVSAMQVQAMMYVRKGLVRDAIEMLQVAVNNEDSINPPAYGPPMDPIKCSHELLAEVLFTQKNYTGAIYEFLQADHWYPNRTLITLGMAKSYAALGNTAVARAHYAELAEQMVDADDGNPILEEATLFLQGKTLKSNKPWSTPFDNYIL